MHVEGETRHMLATSPFHEDVTPTNLIIHLPKISRIPSRCPVRIGLDLKTSNSSLKPATSARKASIALLIRRLNFLLLFLVSETSSPSPSENTAPSQSRES